MKQAPITEKELPNRSSNWLISRLVVAFTFLSQKARLIGPAYFGGIAAVEEFTRRFIGQELLLTYLIQNSWILGSKFIVGISSWKRRSRTKKEPHHFYSHELWIDHQQSLQ